MKKINAYLTFNGNCRSAMTFYQQCLGGELTFQVVGESPLSEAMPKEMKECILHSTLVNGDLMLMASDMVDEQGLAKGNAISMMINCSSEEETRNVFSSLSSGGQENHPLEMTFWGALFGDLTDQFGNHWMVHYEKQEVSNK
jgi:PhnB protein